MGKLECEAQVLGADDVQVGRAAQSSVAFDGFVHHVPAPDLAAVVADHGLYVVTHATYELRARDGLPERVGEHPTRALGVPHQAVPGEGLTVLTGQADEAVAVLETVLALTGLQVVGFHLIGRNDGAELPAYEGREHGVTVEVVGIVDGRAYEEVGGKDLSQGRKLLSLRRKESEQEKEEGEEHLSHNICKDTENFCSCRMERREILSPLLLRQTEYG